jgi:uncharacterized protein
MMNTPTLADVQHRPELGRFELVVDGQLCRADYTLRDGVMLMTHTGVPYALEGHGLAALMVEAAFHYARANGLKIRPLCSYVRVYLQRHPESQDLMN